MTPKDIKTVVEALHRGVLQVEVVEVPGLDAIKVLTHLKDRNGVPFHFYAYRQKRAKKIFLTDSGSIITTLQKSGMEVELKLVQSLLKSYDMILTQDGCAVEQSDRPLWDRVLTMFQAWCAADGVMRTWTRPKD